MITNFFLDNRIGGPHHHIKNINEIGASKKIKFNHVTCGKSSLTKINLTNLRFIFKAFFIFEVILNIIEIFILNYKKKIKKIFFVHGIYNIAPVIAGSLIGKKVFWFILETPSKFLVGTYKIIGFFFNFKTVVISKKIATQLKLKKYIYLPPIINTNFWRKKNLKKPTKKILNILCVGNINKIKGYDFLLNSLSKSKFNWYLTIAGAEINTQKKYLNKIINQIKEIESERKLCKIKFIGWQSQKKLRYQYEVCDIFVLPSYSEGSSIALFEAMSMECFCIAAKVGDVSRIISNRSNGLTFDHTVKSFNNSINYYSRLSPKKISVIKKLARASLQKSIFEKKYYKNFYKRIIFGKLN